MRSILLKNKIIFSISLFFIILPYNLFSQVNNNYITDFKEFKEIIEKVNPQIFLRQKVTGYNILAELEKYNYAVDTCSNIESFTEIIKKCLRANIDSHVYFADSNIIIGLTNKEVKYRGFNQNKMLQSSKIYSKKIKKTSFFNLPVKYISGKYILINDIKIQEQEFKAGSEITKCNNTDIHKFVSTNIGSFYNPVQWDKNASKYYNDYFLYIDTPAVINLTIENKTFSITKQPEISTFSNFLDKKIVQLMDSILYIKVPRMYDSEFYINEIIKYKNAEIKGVVFDIRGNMGGNDAVWKNILSCILPSDFRYNENIFFRNTKLLKKEFGIKAPILKNSLFPRKYFLNFSNEAIIKKSPNSINYNGNIVIIQDREIFSATVNFIETLKQYNKVKFIGETSGWLLSYQSMPRVFSLKNTRLSFVLPVSIDIANIKKLDELFYLNLDNEIEFDLEYYKNIYSQNNTNAILLLDKCFQEAIKILN